MPWILVAESFSPSSSLYTTLAATREQLAWARAFLSTATRTSGTLATCPLLLWPLMHCSMLPMYLLLLLLAKGEDLRSMAERD